MTGRENARFIARVNGVVNLEAYEERILAFSELGVHFDLLVKDYSSGMRSRLAFASNRNQGKPGETNVFVANWVESPKQ